jgi:hypothetical protein
MSTDGWTDGTLTLSKQEINVRTGFLRVNELKFYPENPRLYSIVYSQDKEPSQEFIQKRLSGMEHVKQLVQSIRANGGLTDPLIVRDGEYVVLEGNSRLAAYRILAANDPIAWGKVKCTLLPRNISDALVFALLGEYHIIGKKDWQPYEQAGYLYRRKENHGVDPDKMAEEMGLSTRKVKHLIRVYSFMVDHADDDVTHWSYYDEYLKQRAIQHARSEHPEFDESFVHKVKVGEIEKAVDVREKVKIIAAAGGKILKTFITEDGTLDKCYDGAVARGGDNIWFKRLCKFHEQLGDQDLEYIFLKMKDEQQKKCIFEMKKIGQNLERLIKKIQEGGEDL